MGVCYGAPEWFRNYPHECRSFANLTQELRLLHIFDWQADTVDKKGARDGGWIGVVPLTRR
jgi:hypothetical protein